jgi:hypothetical protein
MKQQAYLASRKVTATAMEQRYAYVYVQVMHERQVNLQQEQARRTWPLEQPNIQSKSA